ncbi:vesicular mannose-binding lectin [Anaeramoeba flamelloides]|uniref:Vesicular mannose-binding lectin n=1 Tax=Anaeramoeba flamelloides TaxID=1746091 RepID=A0ABQ8XXN0_9EUKA|nr:vesicular mannose-binding lectin [Anaeramoeba flamelloides]
MQIFLKLVCVLIFASLIKCDTKILDRFSFNKETEPGILEKNWVTLGSSQFNQNDGLILTQQEKSQQGSIWNKNPFLFENWEMEVEFKIKGGKIGADGIAIWLVKDTEQFGNAFGSKNPFNGLGIFLDTYQNEPGFRRVEEKIQFMIGDGTTFYDSSTDGKSNKLEECLIKYRNKGFSKLRVRYVKKHLSIEIDTGTKQNWFQCINVPSVNISPGNYFGISAATGGLSDRHVIESFTVKRRQNGFSMVSKDPKYTVKKPEKISIFKDIPSGFKFDDDWLVDVKKDTNSIKDNIQRIGQKLITIPRASLKTNTVNDKIISLEKITTLQDSDIKELKNRMNKKFNGFIDLFVSNNDLIDEKITSFTARVKTLSQTFEETRKVAFQVRGDITSNTDSLKERIQSQGYFGIGWFLLIIEMVGVACYLIWKGKKEEKKKYYN